MDDETKKLLQTIAEGTQENNTLLRKMYRSIVWGRIFRIGYWLIIIGLALGAFYVIQPYIEAIAGFTGFKVSGQEGIIEFFKNFR